MARGSKTQLRVLQGYDVPAEGRGFAALITLVRVFGRMSEKMANFVEPFGLTMSQFEVLLCLKGGEGISQQELSERLLVTKGNTCITLQKMEAAALIERKVDPSDQRAHRLYITDVGRTLLAKVLPGHHATIHKILSSLSLPEQKTLHELLVRLDASFDEEES
jgi:DNA-binding MarR family transcriptional regulator